MLKSEWCCKQNLEYQVKTIAIGKFYETIEQLLVLYEKWVLNMSRLEVSVSEFYDPVVHVLYWCTFLYCYRSSMEH